MFLWFNSGECGVEDGCECDGCDECECPLQVELVLFFVVELDAFFVGVFGEFVSVDDDAVCFVVVAV